AGSSTASRRTCWRSRATRRSRGSRATTRTTRRSATSGSGPTRISRTGSSTRSWCTASLSQKGASMTGPFEDDPGFVAVLVTSDAAELAVAKSLLDAEGIECEVEGESGQEVLGLDPLPGATGPMRLMVARADEEAARELLAQRIDATDPEGE